MKCYGLLVTAVIVMVAAGSAHAQLTYKCKNAAGILEYSDKPCPPSHDSVPWRPKYSGNAERLAKQPEKTSDTANAKTAAQQRKSAYTRWLDSREEGEVKKESDAKKETDKKESDAKKETATKK